MSCLPHLKRALLALVLTSSFAQAGETTNKIGITMVDIPAGSFLMGSCKVPSGESARLAEENKKRTFMGQAPLKAALDCDNTDPDADDDETPQHRVNIKAFQMGETEVTLGQFKQFIAAAGRSDLLNDDFMQYNAYGDNAPVVWVRWHDAQDFIKWLNQTEGGGYHLPSEAEWEYACRAGGNHTYCGGNDLNALGWYSGNARRQQDVARKRPNAFGLYDMSGNVWEWVQDCWHNNYQGAPSDGSAWTSSCSSVGRGLRGGSWDLNARYARAADRDDNSPGLRSSSYGFRLARTR